MKRVVERREKWSVHRERERGREREGERERERERDRQRQLLFFGNTIVMIRD